MLFFFFKQKIFSVGTSLDIFFSQFSQLRMADRFFWSSVSKPDVLIRYAFVLFVTLVFLEIIFNLFLGFVVEFTGFSRVRMDKFLFILVPLFSLINGFFAHIKVPH